MRPRFIACLSMFAALLMLASQQVSASEHEKTFGVKTGYVSRNESAVAGLFFQYTISEHFRIAPEVDLAFSHNNMNGILFDINCHFPIAKSGIAEFYPIVGGNYSSWSHHLSMRAQNEGKDVTERVSRFGLNAGAGMDLKLTSTLKVKIEAEYTMVKANNALRATVGIGYSF